MDALEALEVMLVALIATQVAPCKTKPSAQAMQVNGSVQFKQLMSWQPVAAELLAAVLLAAVLLAAVAAVLSAAVLLAAVLLATSEACMQE
jgi:hypothetical protein